MVLIDQILSSGGKKGWNVVALKSAHLMITPHSSWFDDINANNNIAVI